jgi:hypothetical protein
MNSLSFELSINEALIRFGNRFFNLTNPIDWTINDLQYEEVYQEPVNRIFIDSERNFKVIWRFSWIAVKILILRLIHLLNQHKDIITELKDPAKQIFINPVNQLKYSNLKAPIMALIQFYDKALGANLLVRKATTRPTNLKNQLISKLDLPSGKSESNSSIIKLLFSSQHTFRKVSTRHQPIAKLKNQRIQKNEEILSKKNPNHSLIMSRLGLEKLWNSLRCYNSGLNIGSQGGNTIGF